MIVWKYTAHLLRYCAQINPQRIKDTPAVNLCSCLVSVPSISKRAGGAGYLLRRTAKKCPQRIEDTPTGVFCALLAVSERTRMSGVLISSDVFAAQKLASGSVHGCTLPDRLFAKKLTVKGSAERTRTSVVPYRSEFACKLVAHECTRMYIRGRGICGVAILCGKFLEKHANIRIFLAKNLQKSYKDLWR